MSWTSGQADSQDLRGRILAAVDGGLPLSRVAAAFQESRSYIYKALKRRRLTGDSGPSRSRGHNRRKLSPSQETSLAAHMRCRPGITLAKVQIWLEAEHDVRLSTGAVWNAVRRLGLSFKKRP